MAVKIRLKRLGKKKQPVYRVVVSDARTARDGNYIDAIGFYDPRQDPSVIEIENDKAVEWLGKGAQPTEAAKKLLEISGAWTQYRISRGEVHTVPSATTTPAEEPADEPTSQAQAAATDEVAGEPTAEAVAADTEPGDESPESDVSPESPDSEDSPDSPDEEE